MLLYIRSLLNTNPTSYGQDECSHFSSVLVGKMLDTAMTFEPRKGDARLMGSRQDVEELPHAHTLNPKSQTLSPKP